MKALLTTIIIATLLSLTACYDYYLPYGTVAQINGKNISIKDLEAIADSNTAGILSDKLDYSVEGVRKNYTKALGDLIVVTLVEEELEKLGLSITKEDVANEENLIRGDYPEHEFERQLLEDRLDLDIWRKQLKGRLAVRRFHEKVLQPLISVSTEEFKEYSQLHSKNIPSQKYFRLLQSENKSMLENALKTAVNKELPNNFQELFPGVSIKEVRLAINRIEPKTLNQINKLKPGEAGLIFKDPESNEYGAYILLENIEERTMEFSELFKLNEKAILEEKIDFAFKIWIERTVRKAKIRISSYLLTAQNNKKQNPTEVITPTPNTNATESNTLPSLPKPDQTENDLNNATEKITINPILTPSVPSPPQNELNQNQKQ
ncbi:SurA N-terminal domain-containing protein [Desulfovibrio litoralis]|uniref:SurA N-terminal domain-containing protein n=1 Tax=Desulfovibrio litoralis DSM 11393 TaxID=1121455 RepID=A0A1M7RW32_9BACT|nr:SurA N-terminal domain-containing protein [Desulfovibrio litoralis]SHN50328.1 hypothetical protein SAMN02745728_00231 [Desulfovibrio litoralis DSM 11393]